MLIQIYSTALFIVYIINNIIIGCVMNENKF